jgi:hypothetical protein
MTDHTGYPHVERRANQQIPADGWHLDKKVPLSLIAAMIAQVVVVTMFFADIKRDVELLKADNVVLHQRDSAQTVEMREAIKVLQEQNQRMDAKLDRLIERSSK